MESPELSSNVVLFNALYRLNLFCPSSHRPLCSPGRAVELRFSRSNYTIGAQKIFNGSRDLTTPLSETVCRP